MPSTIRKKLESPLEYEQFYNQSFVSAWHHYGLNDDLRVRYDVFINNPTREIQVWFQGQKVRLYDTKEAKLQISDPYSVEEDLSKNYRIYENEQIQCLVYLDGLGIYSEDIAPLGSSDYIITLLSVVSSGNDAKKR